ncbi:MAG: mechanosensitive ion channel family protein [Prevotellaceae bacterium]|nr:mechanosensitive ion channel family protein [Prevotellaceae bacterium]
MFDKDINEILAMTVFGFSIRSIIIFFIKAIIIYLFVRLLTGITKYLFKRSMKKQGKIVLDETKIGFLRQMVVTAIYIIGVSAFLSLIPGMEKVSNSILASAGILAMAVGLASQDALSNIVGGLFIIFSRPFKVGDFIKVDDVVVGTVMEITLRHTIIRNAENRMILIPNSKINSSTIINSSYGDNSTCSFIDIGVSYTVNLDFAIDTMRDEIMKHSLLIDYRTEEEKKNNVPQVVIRVINLGDSAITLRAWAWASTSANATVMKFELLKSIKERFDKEHIEIPYPYFNQILMKES